MTINLHIERLVLDLPVGAGQGALIQSAIETELARLLAGNGLASELMAGGAMPRLTAGSIQLTNDMTPARLGKRIAGAVHSAIGGDMASALQRSETKAK
jgi:hypothetical protein